MGSLIIGFIILLAGAREALFHRKRMIARGKDEALLGFTILGFGVAILASAALAFIGDATFHWWMVDASFWVLGIGAAVCITNIVVVWVRSSKKDDTKGGDNS